MRPLNYLLFFATLALLSCNSGNDSSKELSREEKAALDSISKQTQKLKADSLKKQNPLLILPPDSMYTGSYVDKYPNGIIKFTGFFRFGKRHGQWMAFYTNGEAWSEMHFDKGLRHGPNMTYYENKKMRYNGHYKNDMKDSLWIYYDTSGAVIEKIVFRDDKIVKRLPVK